MADADRSVFYHGLPWVEPSDELSQLHSRDITRGFVVLPYQDAPVYCDECKDPLPVVGLWTDRNRNRWSRYELPRGEDDNSWSKVIYSRSASAGQEIVTVPLGRGISRSLLDEHLEYDEVDAPAMISAELSRYSKLRDLVDTHTEFVNDLCDDIKSNKYYFEGNFGGLSLRSVMRVTSVWLKTEDQDTARLALIVKLAREISRVLAHVCEHPRVVLRRAREFQKISKIQEVDPACLRWLARQPGRDVYERAGARQQLLGVVRKEDTDTPENRVVKDLLHRARIECANYVSIYRDHMEHDRVRTVMNFRKQITGWERQSEISKAKRLVGPIQPNYVLLHEPKYRKLWDAYQLLLSQQKQKDDIWKWRDRTFCEACEIAVLSVVRKIARRSQLVKSDVALEQEAVNGQFLSRFTELGSAKVNTGIGTLHVSVCRGTQANSCPYIERGFYPLSADLYVIAHDLSSTKRIVPIWCFFDGAPNSLNAGLQLLEEKLNRLPYAESIRPLILIFSETNKGWTFFNKNGGVIPLNFPLLNSFNQLEQVLLHQLAIR